MWLSRRRNSENTVIAGLLEFCSVALAQTAINLANMLRGMAGMKTTSSGVSGAWWCSGMVGWMFNGGWEPDLVFWGSGVVAWRFDGGWEADVVLWAEKDSGGVDGTVEGRA
ncbi:hypothetical protein EDC01DRAFT_678412 [Geopyxis carbonaria]|nr:hypothetical protein EDC01DRAFT_678412 [Geopyxis carbonaria]